MRRSAGVLGLMMLFGCATGAEQEASRIQKTVADGTAEVAACSNRIKEIDALVPLQAKMPSDFGATPSLAQLSDSARPSATDIPRLYEFHAALQPCRKLSLDRAAAIHPAFVVIVTEHFSAQDQRFLKLAKREMSWGDAAQSAEKTKQETRQKTAQFAAALNQQLANAHAYEVQQRQQAAQALMVWGMYQQQLELQRQAIAASTRPTMTTCNYVGRQLQCTSY